MIPESFTVAEARLVDGDRHLDLVPQDPNLAITKLDIGFPEVRESSSFRPDADGTHDQTTLVGARGVTLEAYIIDNVEATRDRLYWFMSPSRRPWLVYRTPGGEERMLQLRAQQASAPLLSMPSRTTTVVQCQWKAPQGFVVSAEPTKVSAGPFAAVVGRTYLRSYDRVYPFTSGGVVQMVNAGNVATHPLIRIYGPCVNPRIENITTGERMEFTARDGIAVLAGDYLEVDSQARTVRLNGDVQANRLRHVNYADPARSEWLTLAPGVNEVRFYPFTFSGSSQAVFTWRSAWI